MIRKFMKITIKPLVLFGLLFWLGKYFYMVDGEVDWFRAMIIFGLSFGIPYMFWLVPIKGSVSSMAVVWVLDIIVGSVFGIFIAGWVLLKAIVNIPVSLICYSKDRHKCVI